MAQTFLDLDGGKVALLERGTGVPVLYLHGIADVHGFVDGWQPFHEQLTGMRLIAPAHPGCAGSDTSQDIDTIDDVVIHYLDVLDALALDRVHVIGACVGGWIGAEIAVRNPQRVSSLTLMGATGLYLEGQPIADVFMAVQARNGGDLSDLRGLMFAEPESAIARQWVPDGPQDEVGEMLRYKAFAFAARIGFRPPYLYDRKLVNRLRRVRVPTQVIWGSRDRMVPLAHANAYGEGIRHAQKHTLEGAGHCVWLERPAEVAQLVGTFVANGTAK